MGDSKFSFSYPIKNNFKLLEGLLSLSNVRALRSKSDIENVQDIAGYAHKLFSHDGNNTPSHADPLTILTEAKAGQSFRCVEYSILVTDLLWANGIPARTLGLKTKDVETREYGAGHVVIEFWSEDYAKWIMIDVQAGIIPSLDNTYLSAHEFKQALSKDGVRYECLTGSRYRENQKYDSQPNYSHWIHKYLFFIDTPLALTLNDEHRHLQKIVMLVPIGTGNPKSFQGMFSMNAIYAHSVLDFYARPV